MDDQEREEYFNEFFKLAASGDMGEAFELRDRMALNDLVANLQSVLKDGVPYLYVGHLDELFEVYAKDTLDAIEDFSKSSSEGGTVPPYLAGYVIGVFDVIRVIALMSKALAVKHSDEINIPVDTLIDEIHKSFEGEDE